MNIGKWVKTPKQFFILGNEIRAKGKWIENKIAVATKVNGIMITVVTHCSNCGYKKETYSRLNYCPNCGASMGEDIRGEEQ